MGDVKTCPLKIESKDGKILTTSLCELLGLLFHMLSSKIPKNIQKNFYDECTNEAQIGAAIRHVQRKRKYRIELFLY